MSVSYHAPAPVNTPHLRLLRDEEDVPYDTAPPRREPFTMIPRWVLEEHGAKVGIVAWGVFTALAHHADDQGRCYPSTTRVGKLLGIHRVTVSEAIAKLVAAGLVVTEERRTETGAQTSNGYVLPCLCLSSTATGVQSTATPPVALDDTPCSPGLHKREPVNENQSNENGGTPLFPPAGGKTKPPAKRRTTVPEDFVVTGEMRAWAVGKGVPAAAVDEQTEQFIDHHRHKGTLGLDWVRGWQTWMRNAVAWGRFGPAGTSANGVPGHAIRNGRDIGYSNEELDAMIGRGRT